MERVILQKHVRAPHGLVRRPAQSNARNAALWANPKRVKSGGEMVAHPHFTKDNPVALLLQKLVSCAGRRRVCEMA